MGEVQTASHEQGDAPKKAPSGLGGAVTRRTFAIGVGSAAALAGLGALRYVGTESLVRPPGGQDEDALTARCIRCGRCMKACPYNLVVPSSIEQGIVNMRTPRMEFSATYPGVVEDAAYCDMCGRANDGVPLCAQSCPSGALVQLSPEEAAEVVLGVAVIDSSTCLAYRSGYCSLCQEACAAARGEEHAAIYFKEGAASADSSGVQSTKVPVVDAALCNGCGACESVCISAQAGSTVGGSSRRAIAVVPQESAEATL